MGNGQSLNPYSIHDIQIGVACESSVACGNISTTMQRIKEDSATLAGPLRIALRQPMMQVVGTHIDRHVSGDPAPGSGATALRARNMLSRGSDFSGGAAIGFWVAGLAMVAVVCAAFCISLFCSPCFGHL